MGRYKLELKTLKCNADEDWYGDEVVMKIFVDSSSLTETKTRDMDDTEGEDEWHLNLTYTFDEYVEIRLYDDD